MSTNQRSLSLISNLSRSLISDLSFAAHLDWIQMESRLVPNMSARWSRAYLEWFKQLLEEIRANLTPRTLKGTRISNEEARNNLEGIDFSKVVIPVPTIGETARASIVRNMSTLDELPRRDLRAAYAMSPPPPKRMKATTEAQPKLSHLQRHPNVILVWP
jgi:hypothetical protein